ncbi:armadillo-type protein [Fomitopsis serialis]|uniref:armadillo-type protein n=1 Tax=Fomitopsis serialis TaxID=139415 RepID=UPI00200873F7|nr:armadillo-type protein [Neoantrodia serialis]KAH9919371.1 armadillo-type protein [Neoantrodia serialis]
MYARLCRKMMEQISPKVQDEGIKNVEGKPIAGGQLFRKYLLNGCQEDFEHGWAAKESTAAAAATKATADRAARDAADKDEDGETALYSEEYYAAQKAKRQGLGLIKFLGELFKLQMLTERIMHECVKKLLGNVENPEEEEIESLCMLLTTVGKTLDTPKARAHMDVYFARMKELTRHPNVNSRMQSILLNLLEFRERKWSPRNLAATPTTIAAVHARAARETAANRAHSMSYSGSKRDGDHCELAQAEFDDWSSVDNASRRVPVKAGALDNLCEIRNTNSTTFDSTGVFAKEKNKHESSPSSWGSHLFSKVMGKPELEAEAAIATHSQVGLDPDGRSVAESTPRRMPAKAGDVSNLDKTNSMTCGHTGVLVKNMHETASPSFRELSDMMEDPEPAADTASARTWTPSRDASVDFGSAGVPDVPPQRRKPNLLPCTLPRRDETLDCSTPDRLIGSNALSMSEEAKTRVGEDSKEFFSIRDLDEAEVYFSKLPSEHRWLLVDKLVTSAIESNDSDARLVGDLFSRAVSKDLCSPEAFEKGFAPTAEILDDIVIDARGAEGTRPDG